jgi:hypothetical protein
LDASQIHDVVSDDLTPDRYLAELRDQDVAVHVASAGQATLGEEAHVS